MSDSKQPVELQAAALAHDDLHRFISQTHALMVLVSSHSALNNLPRESIDDVVWLIHDRVDDIRTAYERLCDAEREVA